MFFPLRVCFATDIESLSFCFAKKFQIFLIVAVAADNRLTSSLPSSVDLTHFCFKLTDERTDRQMGPSTCLYVSVFKLLASFGYLSRIYDLF